MILCKSKRDPTRKHGEWDLLYDRVFLRSMYGRASYFPVIG